MWLIKKKLKIIPITAVQNEKLKQQLIGKKGNYQTFCIGDKSRL